MSRKDFGVVNDDQRPLPVFHDYGVDGGSFLGRLSLAKDHVIRLRKAWFSKLCSTYGLQAFLRMMARDSLYHAVHANIG